MPKTKTKNINILNNTIPQNNINTVNNLDNITDSPIIEVVDIANKSLLENPKRANKYFLDLCEKIINDQKLEYKATPKDPEKVYPRLDVFSWSIVLLYIRYELEETQLLILDNYKGQGQKYNYNYVLRLADIYIYLCKYYGMIPDSNSFIDMTGITPEIFYKWASSGGVLITKKIDEIGKNQFKTTFLNSKIPIERIYTANNLYGMDKNPENASEKDLQLETLPDLLCLSDGQKEIVDGSHTTLE